METCLEHGVLEGLVEVRVSVEAAHEDLQTRAGHHRREKLQQVARGQQGFYKTKDVAGATKRRCRSILLQTNIQSTNTHSNPHPQTHKTKKGGVQLTGRSTF